MTTETHTTTRLQKWGGNVEAKRLEANLTQIQLAGLTAVTQQTISRIELGRQNISDGLKMRIARALETAAGELFPLEGE